MESLFAFAEAAKGPNFGDIGLILLAGLAVFLYGVDKMSHALKAVAGERMKAVLERATRNRFAGLASGTIATVVVDSSSLTCIATVSLVSAGLMSFANALAVVMGANIGTTFSSQLIAYDATKFAGVVLAIGLGLRFLGRSDAVKGWGAAVIGLGMVFLGLETIDRAMEPMKDYPPFLDLLARTESVGVGILVGAAFTSVIQSSSATVGIVILLAGQGTISLASGIALMMGAELGTCVDVLVSTIGRGRAAARVGAFQLLFNLANVLLLVGMTGPLARVATTISPGEGAKVIGRQIANAHVLFNVVGVLAFIAFTPWIAKALERLIPDRKARPEAAPSAA